MKKFLLSAFAVMALAACGTGEGEAESQITLPDGAEKNQTVYADEETGGFTFTAKSSWTASVTESTRASSVSWLRLLLDGTETYSGGAGTVTLTIEFDANLSGADRKATITITCGNDRITVTVEQKSTTEDGTVPDGPITYDRLVARITETDSDGDYEWVHETDFTYDTEGRVVSIHEYDNGWRGYIYKFSYGDGTVSISQHYADMPEDADWEFECTLDANGYVDKVVRLNSDGSAYDEELRFTYNNGYVSRIYRIDPDNDNYLYGEDNYTWTAGNMTKIASDYGEDKLYEYSANANNKVNIDLNVLFMDMSSPTWSSDKVVDMLAYAGYVGKRSLNHTTSHYIYMTSSAGDKNDPYIYTSKVDTDPLGYAFDGEGYVTKITGTYVIKNYRAPKTDATTWELTGTTNCTCTYEITYIE